LDSGDLAYLSRIARNMLDEAGLDYMNIIASNQLDEFVIKSLMEQNAPIDIFGVGTSLVTGRPDAALDGVYKLSAASGKPKLKLSESLQKVTLPGVKKVMRVIDKNEMFFGADVVVLDEEQNADVMFHPFEPGKTLSIENCGQQLLLQKIMNKGKITGAQSSIHDIADYAQKRLTLLPAEYKRFENPHIYKVGISEKLMNLRSDLSDELKKHKQ
jgi:nicotinate phosphoribosyltransferase